MKHAIKRIHFVADHAAPTKCQGGRREAAA